MIARTRSAQSARTARIAIAFASESVDLLALDAVTRLAASLHAEIAGLFVEDINLIRLAGLPVARAISRSGTPQALDVVEMERQLRAQAEAVRQKVSALAQRAGVRWSFEVARGTLAHEIARAVGEGDLVALGVTRRTVLAGTLALGPSAPRREEREGLKRPVVALFTGSPASTRALRLAATFAETLERPFSVLLVAKDDASLARLKDDAQALVGPRDMRFRRLIDPTVAAVRDAAETERAEVLLIEQGATVLDPDAVQMLNDELSCPSLIVR